MKIFNFIVSIVLIVAVALLISGCSVPLNFSYKNSSEYTAGDGEVSGVKNVEIDWISGNVEIVSNKGKSVVISETANKELEDIQKVHWWLDGDTLRVKYCASGKSWGTKFNGVNKSLTISVPEDMMLTELNINTVSADFNVSGINVGKTDIDTVSGSLSLNYKMKTLNLDSVSGNIEVKAADGVECDADTVSGDIKIDITGCGGITVNYDTVSGRLSGDVEFKIDGHKYVNGDGSADFKINTVSGDVKIVKAE